MPIINVKYSRHLYHSVLSSRCLSDAKIGTAITKMVPQKLPKNASSELISFKYKPNNKITVTIDNLIKLAIN